MRHRLTSALVCAATISTSAAHGQDRFPANGGDISIRPLVHASVEIEFNGRVVHVDPWSIVDLTSARRADLILVTDADNGGHHLDPKAIELLRKPGAPVVIPALGKSKVPDGIVLENGRKQTVAGLDVEAIAAYDLSNGEPYHPKGKTNGYVLTIGGKRLYFVGVTECVPEIRALKNIDVMFVPMNLPLGRMSPPATADCLRAVKPKVAYPYHYDVAYQRKQAASSKEIERTLDVLGEMVRADGVEVRRGPWYPAP
jgi:L-ascorbate metabolism protein UlaG (beta-lactamase superfamily)